MLYDASTHACNIRIYVQSLPQNIQRKNASFKRSVLVFVFSILLLSVAHLFLVHKIALTNVYFVVYRLEAVHAN